MTDVNWKRGGHVTCRVRCSYEQAPVVLALAYQLFSKKEIFQYKVEVAGEAVDITIDSERGHSRAWFQSAFNLGVHNSAEIISIT